MESSGKWRLAMMAITMTAACFVAGYLFLSPGKTQEQAPPPPSPQTAIAATESERKQRYNLTIESDADWARITITNGTFITDPSSSATGLELTSQSPEQLNKFTYSANEIALIQKQWGHAKITLKCMVECADSTLQVKTGHGDNGKVTIRSANGSITNDQVTGDGNNYQTIGLRLE